MDKHQLFEEQVANIIDLALDEDLGHGDVTTEALIPSDLKGKASVLIKEPGVLAGIEIAGKVFRRVDPSLEMETLIKDGTRVQPGDVVATVSGGVASILKAERIAINFLQRLSGIATQTAEYVAKTGGFTVDITDTRKTTPGLRFLEKYAVLKGGGKNHRLHLGDGILVKDNHLAALRAMGMSLKEIVLKAKRNAPPGMLIEIEVTSAEEATEVAAAGADIILLDNMAPGEMRRVLNVLPDRVMTEASGGITLASVHDAAAAGVNRISVGALTHSSRALNISLELEF
ncbi:MAG: carboxylating nicotinate-nucleotide diphosphorylase [Chloroflexi bacterium]|nr:carboxylating nicotinate-nucleotide diphosphorylase [Chloroflexota bacterium]